MAGSGGSGDSNEGRLRPCGLGAAAEACGKHAAPLQVAASHCILGQASILLSALAQAMNMATVLSGLCCMVEKLDTPRLSHVLS